MKKSHLKTLIREIIREVTTRSELDLGTMKAVNVEEANQPIHIGQGFYKISQEMANKLSGGKLAKPGYEKLVQAPEGFETTKGFAWLSQRPLGGIMSWSLRDSKNWVMKDGRAVLSQTEETGTGAVAGYQTPMRKPMKKLGEMTSSGAAGGYQTKDAFSTNKKGSQRAIDATVKGTGWKVVGEAPRI